MKFICETALLSSAVNNVQRAVTSKSSLATLEGILIRTNGNEVILSGYDLEIAMKTKIPADIEVEGCTVINAKILGEILRKLPYDKVTIDIYEDNKALITSGTSEFNIIALDANEYPELPSLEDESEIKVPADVLKSMVSQTIFSVSTSDDRPVYKGILFEIEENQIKLVSTDGCRLAIRKEEINTNENMHFVVPSKGLQEVLKLIDDDMEEEVVINVGKRHISFEIGKFFIISRLIEGEFFNYNNNSVIPDGEQTVIETETREFLNLIERISLVIVDRVKSPVRCSVNDGQVYMRCSTIMGKSSDVLECDMTGKSQEIGFNSRFFIEALRAVDTDKIKIVMNGAQRPIKILPMEGDNFLFIVVPVIMKAEN
ncbi:MAG: DNA polymerase III subunit beta [Clostridia bacterium]|nr:DNA polymerase III subunit beta [Clostridia bacterium]